LRSRQEGTSVRKWPHYGWFKVLAFSGSLFGALAYGFRLKKLESFFLYTNLSRATSRATAVDLYKQQSILAQSRLFSSAEFALFPFETFLVAMAKLLILQRMELIASNHSFRTSHSKLWSFLRRAVQCIAVLLSLLGICGNFGAAYYYKQTSIYNQDSADAFFVNNTIEGDRYRLMADRVHSKANEVASIQRLSEVILWLVIVAAFLAVGVLSAKVISSTLLAIFTVNNSADISRSQRGRDLVEAINLHAKSLQRKIVATFVFVSLALLVRAVFTTFYGVAQAFQDFGVLCASNRCDPCQNVYSHIQGWLVYTPAFQMTSLLVSSPLALLFAFWGLSDPGKPSSDFENSSGL
jgi:hypothetical protein